MPKSAEEIGLETAKQIFGTWAMSGESRGLVLPAVAEKIAAAIREDRAEPITEALNKFEDFINLPSEYEDSSGWRVRDYRHELWSKWTELRAALEAARKARATADEKGGAR